MLLIIALSNIIKSGDICIPKPINYKNLLQHIFVLKYFENINYPNYIESLSILHCWMLILNIFLYKYISVVQHTLYDFSFNFSSFLHFLVTDYIAFYTFLTNEKYRWCKYSVCLIYIVFKWKCVLLKNAVEADP